MQIRLRESEIRLEERSRNLKELEEKLKQSEEEVSKLQLENAQLRHENQLLRTHPTPFSELIMLRQKVWSLEQKLIFYERTENHRMVFHLFISNRVVIQLIIW